MSDTPRAEHAAETFIECLWDKRSTVGEMHESARALVNEAFALERELAAANQALDARDKRWQQDLDAASKELARATEADISQMRKIMRERFERIEILQNELAAERAAREDAEQERDVLRDCQFHNENELRRVDAEIGALRAELAAANEAREKAKADLASREQDAWRAGYDFAKLHFYDIPLRHSGEMYSLLAGVMKERDALCAEVERLRDTINQQEIYISDIKRIFCESDKKAVEEAEAKAARLREAVKEARFQLSNLPHSYGYAFTHVPKLDALLKETE